MPVLKNTESTKTPKHFKHEDATGVRLSPGPYVGIVKNNVDPMRSGRLMVWIPELGGANEDEANWRVMNYCTPFYGATSYVTRGKSQGFDAGSPHSYGMWFVPPDVGVKVLCTFANGDPFRGYWFGCIPEWPNLHMVPGIASGSWHGEGPEPLLDFNAEDPSFDPSNFFKMSKTATNKHDYQTDVWSRQGLLGDPYRGPGTSSAFRETPSRVFGISTPGPEVAIPNNADINNPQQLDLNVRSRQGGHQFVMDDGDAQGNSQLIRLRTSNGNMLLLNDSAGIVYLINAKGNAWFELDGNGNIRAYAGGKFEVSAAEICLNAKGPVHISGATVDIAATASLKMKGMTADLMGMMGTKVGGMGDLHLSGMKSYLSGKMCVGISGKMHVDMKAGCITLNTKMVTEASMPGAASPCSGPTHEPYGHGNSRTSSPAVSKSYEAAAGVQGGNSGNYGAAASFGATASVPKYYGVVTNQNGPIKFNPGFQGSLAGQASNLGDATKYNAFDSNSVMYTNVNLTLPVASSGFAVNVRDPNNGSTAGLTPGEALNNPGLIKSLKDDPFAIGQVNGINVYATPEDGIAALTLLLDLIQASGSKTVNDVLQNYVKRKGLTI